MRRSPAPLLALILAVFLQVSSPASAKTPETPEALRILFVGNSLTYTNDLPRIVAALAATDSVPVATGMIAFPNASLEDHWHDGRARREIATKRWDVVVLQQGPSSLASSRADLVAWASKFAVEIRAAGARPALYTVWPDVSRRSYFPDVIESYAMAAAACGCELLPAGAAWHQAWKQGRGLQLYGADGFHPSRDGSYLAALVIWGALGGGDLSAAPARLELDDGEVFAIREKAARIYRVAATAALSAN